MSRKETIWSVSSVVACVVVAGAALITVGKMEGPAGESAVKAVQPEEAIGYARFIEGSDEPIIADSPPNTIDWYKQNWSKRLPGIPYTEACFAPGTPEEIMRHVNETMGYSQEEERYVLNTRWTGTAGSNRVITWSFVPDGLNIPSGVGEPAGPSVLFANMDAQFAAQGGRATWILRVQQIFDRWAALGGTSYVRVQSGLNDWDDGAAWGTAAAAGLRGDVRIGSHNIDGAFNVLAYNFFPQNGDMVIDSSENWAQQAALLNRFFRNTLAHEHGHGMGLSHSCPLANIKLMEPQLSTAFDGPRHDDIRGQQRHYGDDREDNNTSAAASNLGVLEAGSPIAVGTLPPIISGVQPTFSSTASIDANGEEDWFRFTLNGMRLVSVSLAPQGHSYDQSVQSSASCGANPASCCSGNVSNSISKANLNFQIVDSNGVTVLATADTQASGTAEAINNFPIGAAGNYYIRVYEGDAPTESQLYMLNLSAAACPDPPPGIAPLPDSAASCGASFTGPTPVPDGGQQFTYSLVGTPPPGMTINPNTGVVSWSPTVASPTPYVISVQSSGPCGNDVESFDLTVAAGDVTGDGLVSDLDVPLFADIALGLAGPICAADMNGDGVVDGLDMQLFTDAAQ